MHDSDHVLANLDLPLVTLQVFVDGVVLANLMPVENLHAARRDRQTLRLDKVLRFRQENMTVMLEHVFGELRIGRHKFHRFMLSRGLVLDHTLHCLVQRDRR